MLCFKDGNCIMNAKINSGVDFCVSPTCVYYKLQKRAIASRIAKILRKDILSACEKEELEYLKREYEKLKFLKEDKCGE